jgi:hypothetical protein
MDLTTIYSVIANDGSINEPIRTWGGKEMLSDFATSRVVTSSFWDEELSIDKFNTTNMLGFEYNHGTCHEFIHKRKLIGKAVKKLGLGVAVYQNGPLGEPTKLRVIFLVPQICDFESRKKKIYEIIDYLPIGVDQRSYRVCNVFEPMDQLVYVDLTEDPIGSKYPNFDDQEE